MIRRILLAASITCLAVIFFSGCVIGSGNLVSREYERSGFSSVEAGHGFRLNISRSSEFHVEITADDNIIDYIEVKTFDDTLRIRLRPFSSVGKATLRAEISMPELRGVDLSGGSRTEISGFESTDSFSLALSGGSDLKGDIVAGNVDVDLSGGSVVELEGTGKRLVVDGSGGSDVHFRNFPVENADIRLSGGGKATVNVSGSLNVDLSGGSSLIYQGDPRLGEIDLSGGSTIRKS